MAQAKFVVFLKNGPKGDKKTLVLDSCRGTDGGMKGPLGSDASPAKNVFRLSGLPGTSGQTWATPLEKSD